MDRAEREGEGFERGTKEEKKRLDCIGRANNVQKVVLWERGGAPWPFDDWRDLR